MIAIQLECDASVCILIKAFQTIAILTKRKREILIVFSFRKNNKCYERGSCVIWGKGYFNKTIKSRKREKIPYGKKSNLLSRKNEFLGKLIDNNIV